MLAHLTSCLLMTVLAAGPAAPTGEPAWADHARQVHAKFSGQKGTLAAFGDSITVTLAFWTPLLYKRTNAPAEMEEAFALVKRHLAQPCWRDWKGPRFGNEGMKTTRWALDHVDEWLKRLNPEAVVILFGTNDLNDVDAARYARNMRDLTDKCLANGTVPILTTIPPRHGRAEKAAAFAKIVRDLAGELKLPLIDYHAEILRRRPDDWDGADEKFREHKGYDVPTLLARDGVHPSHPKAWQDDYSDEALGKCGFCLRNCMTLMTYARVLNVLGDKPPPDGKSPGKDQCSAPPAKTENSSAPPAASQKLHDILAQPWLPKAPPLPAAPASAIRVANPKQLREALAAARPGQTILLADGLYNVDRYVEIRADNVTLRSASGNRTKVVLDGGGHLGELLGLRGCKGVTIADLTVQNVKWNGIKINSETNVQKLTIRNCVLRNVWQRAVKGVMVPPGKERPAGFVIEYCLFMLDRPKTYDDDEADKAHNFGGNYIGGIDAMSVEGWTIRDNVFVGIHGRTGSARGAIFLWVDSRNCLIERNVIVDCDSGICLGNSHRHPGTRVHCTGFVVRNNFLTRTPENGILADYTKDCRILHNTVCDPAGRFGRCIRLVHDNDALVVANNLLAGPEPRVETQSHITLAGNVALGRSADLPARYFVNPALGDLHLKAEADKAIGKADPAHAVDADIDRQTRRRPSDVGADQRE